MAQKIKCGKRKNTKRTKGLIKKKGGLLGLRMPKRKFSRKKR